MAAEKLWKAYGEECVITSGDEIVNEQRRFVHSTGSLHYYGLALDFRTRYFKPGVIMKLARALRIEIGNDYDVVIEKTHIHVEYDPD